MKLSKNAENPILLPRPGHSWENLVVCNPGAIRDNGTFHMLYRASGDDADHVIHFAYATSRDGIQLERQSDRPDR